MPDDWMNKGRGDRDVPPASPPIACEPMHEPLTTWADLAQNMPSVEWLWPGWLPKGFVVMLTGETGKGKSALALRIAMSIIMGSEWPDGTAVLPGGGKVLWCESESAQVINFDRARQWGGDRLLRGLVNPTIDLFTETRIDRAADLQRITEISQHPDIRLLVVDSLSGSHRTDENSAESGRVVQTLGRITQDGQKPLILTHHLRKRGMQDSDVVTLDRVRGSTALVQYARVVWAVDAPNPADPEALRLSVIKSNLGKFPRPLGMRIDGAGVTFTPDAPIPPQRMTALDIAIQFLQEHLGNGEMVPARVIELARAEARIADRTLDRAKKVLNVAVAREDGHWYWYLPTEN